MISDCINMILKNKRNTTQPKSGKQCRADDNRLKHEPALFSTKSKLTKLGKYDL